MQSHGLMRSVKVLYQFKSEMEPEKKPIITIALEKFHYELSDMKSIDGFTLAFNRDAKDDAKISFSIDLNSKNFKEADVSFRWAVHLCQKGNILYTRDVTEILKCYENLLSAQGLLVENKSQCAHKDFKRLGDCRPDGNAF